MAMTNILSQEDQAFLDTFLDNFLDAIKNIPSTGIEVGLDKIGQYVSNMPVGDAKYLGKLVHRYNFYGVYFAIEDSLAQKNATPILKYVLATVASIALIPASTPYLTAVGATFLIGVIVESYWQLAEWIAENQDDILEKLKQLLADKGVEINDDGSIQCELPTYINICPLPKEPICKIKDLFGTAEEVRSPLVVDMDGDGVETVTAEGGVYFDHDANGFKENSGWVGQDDGILVRDINGNGIIDNGTELFGNNSVLSSGEKAVNGFEALKDLDDNNDGIFDRNDNAWNEVKIWQDKNFNGNYSNIKPANPVFA